MHWVGLESGRRARIHSLSSPANLLRLLIAEFADIFVVPQSLPLARAADHRIHLLPGTPPVAVWPYRYPQLLKDEIEQQCADI